MYSVVRKGKKGKISEINEEGFLMGKKNAVFEVNNTSVKNIVVCNRYLANPVVVVKVNSIYKKLLIMLTDLLTEDDDGSGENYREALNQIERFRIIIKNTEKALFKASFSF